jgi:hypothetical protein
MPDRPLPSDTREAPSRFWDKRYVVMGIVAACVLTALAILGGGMFDTGEKDTTQPPRPVTTQSDTQAPAITQPSFQPPAADENRAP